jgi:hypothetical protein
VTKCRNFGVYLGTRYKSFTNVVWVNGVDFQTWNVASSPSDDRLTQAVAQGIASVAPHLMQTVELNYILSTSLNDPTWSPPVNLDWVYDQLPQYGQMYAEYNRTVPRSAIHRLPYFLGEGDYEGENNTGRDPSTPLVLRKQEYWTALSGATGQMFGNHFTWQFLSGWQHDIKTVGSGQFIIMSRLLASVPWWTLVPDQMHNVVTAGYGTFNPNDTITQSDYATTARTADGEVVMTYLPTIRTITVDMTKLRDRATARWFDPTVGSYTTIAGSPFSNKGNRRFTPPGPNRAGAGDWVLVLMAGGGRSRVSSG